MNRATAVLSPEEESQAAPHLDVFVLYEDCGTALRARLSLDALPASIRETPGFHVHLWNMKLLQQPFLREVAAVQAASAQVVLVSVHGRKDLPQPATEWLQSWRNHRGVDSNVLGLLMDADPPGRVQDRPVSASLARVAREAGSDFIYGCFHDTGNAQSISLSLPQVFADPPSSWRPSGFPPG